jgi:hypothetical protein
VERALDHLECKSVNPLDPTVLLDRSLNRAGTASAKQAECDDKKEVVYKDKAVSGFWDDSVGVGSKLSPEDEEMKSAEDDDDDDDDDNVLAFDDDDDL